MTNLDTGLKRDNTLLTKSHLVKAVFFSSSYVHMWELDHKNAGCWRIDAFELLVLKKSFESPLDSKEIKPVNPKGNQAWMSIVRTDAGKDWGHEEKWVTDHERWDGWMASPTQWTWVRANSLVKHKEAWCAVIHAVTKGWTQLSDWSTTTTAWTIREIKDIVPFTVASKRIKLRKEFYQGAERYGYWWL